MPFVAIVRIFFCAIFSRPSWSHNLQFARWQKEKPWILFSWVWITQSSIAGKTSPWHRTNKGNCAWERPTGLRLTKIHLPLQVWGCDIIVDWADPQEEPDESTMSKVKVLYVRNLTQDISEEKLKEAFEQFGKVERVKKIKDYAFVHFEDRDHAVIAMRDLDGKEIGCSNIEVSPRVILYR